MNKIKMLKRRKQRRHKSQLKRWVRLRRGTQLNYRAQLKHKTPQKRGALLNIRTLYKAKLAKFDREYAMLQKEAKTRKPYTLATKLWVMAYDLKEEVPENVEEVFVEGLRKRIVATDNNEKGAKRTEKKDADQEKEEKDNFMLKHLHRNYAKQEEAYNKDNGRPKPTMALAYRAYIKEIEKVRVDARSIDRIKKEHQRLKENRTKQEKLAKKHLGPDDFY